MKLHPDGFEYEVEIPFTGVVYATEDELRQIAAGADPRQFLEHALSDEDWTGVRAAAIKWAAEEQNRYENLPVAANATDAQILAAVREVLG